MHSQFIGLEFQKRKQYEETMSSYNQHFSPPLAGIYEDSKFQDLAKSNMQV
jgi:hypothetical protein